ncbi:MAG: cysteine synthase A [Oscillospiraceae bacterium]|nr:cysteine synthase A [Oscillospiraceae bacterium]
MNVATQLPDLIGNTPMLELTRCGQAWGTVGRIFAKLEYFNPLGSAKDRVAREMIADAERRGVLTPGAVVIEPTSGNTGVGLAFVCSSKGYPLILTMPESMSMERRMLLGALGAQLVLTPAKDGMAGAVEKAKQLQREHPGSFIPDQFNNPANAAAHEKTTAQEILRDLDGQVDAVIATVGTGGTLTGTGHGIRKVCKDCRIIAVEPAGSPLLTKGYAGAHKIQGIGANFIPSVLDRAQIDEVIDVADEDAFEMCRYLAKTEGLLVGISAGAAAWAAKQVALRPEFAGKKIAVIFTDTGERYLSSGVFGGAE